MFYRGHFALVAAATLAPTVALGADFVAPETGTVTASFEARTAAGTQHGAIDIRGAGKTTVTAARGGTVTYAGPSRSGGSHVIVDHGNGYSTVYACLASLAVTKGESVKTGQTLGTETSHLHFEIRRYDAKRLVPGKYGDRLVRGQAIAQSYPGIDAKSALTNVARGKPTAASSSWSSQYDAAKAFDGDTGTGWSPTAADRNPWLLVDLGAPHRLERLELVTRQELDQPETRASFELWASNDSDMSKGHVVLARQGTPGLPFKATFTAGVTDTKSYRYVAAVKSVPGYLYVTELRVFGAPTGAAPAPAPAPASIWQKAGVWVWHADAFSPGFHGDLMVQNRLSWVTVQLHDGLTPINEAHLAAWIPALRAKGISVGCWGVNRTEPEAEAQLAASLIKKWGFDFYIADAELEYKYTSANGSPDGVAYGRSQRFVKAFRPLAPSLPCGVSSYGRADMCDIDWAAWRSAGFVYLPQTYWNDDDIYEPASCMDGAVKAGWPRSQVFPTIGIWGGGNKGYVSATDYVASLTRGKVQGFSVYLGESMPLADWPVLGAGVRSGLAR